MPDTQYLQDVLIFLVAAVVAVPIFQKIKLGAVLGFLVAGIAIGPFGLVLIDNVDGTKALAELGVVFLLFTIGLELSFDRLRAIGARMYCLGLAQVLVTAGAICGLLMAFGFSFATGVMIGGGVALSSTAIAIQVLKDRGQMKTEMGRVGLAILLVQDLAVGPLLVIAQVLSTQGSGAEIGAALGFAALKAALAIGLILLIGHYLLRPALRLVAEAHSPELFAATALLVALGTSYATEHAGLSMAFGAFLAGLILAETEYRYQVEADIEPFRGILLGLFFMTVGMSIDIHLAMQNLGLVAVMVLGLMLAKGIILALLAKLFGLSGGRSLRLAILLSQGGEFAFVLIGISIGFLVVPEPLGQKAMLAVAISMAATPLIENYGTKLLTFLEKRDAITPEKDENLAGLLGGHVIIIGYGEVGRIVSRMMRAHGNPYVILDQIPSRVMEGTLAGEPAYYGDGTSLSVLRALDAEGAAAVIIATERRSSTLHLVDVIHGHFPDLPVFARGGSEDTAKTLRAAGITDVVSETMETGLRLAGGVIDYLRAREAAALGEDIQPDSEHYDQKAP